MGRLVAGRQRAVALRRRPVVLWMVLWMVVGVGLLMGWQVVVLGWRVAWGVARVVVVAVRRRRAAVPQLTQRNVLGLARRRRLLVAEMAGVVEGVAEAG